MSDVLQWRLADGTRLAFSCRADGDLKDAAQRAVWAQSLGLPAPLVVPGQVHGAQVVPADGPAAERATADGLVLAQRGGALGVFGSDCPGLVISAGATLGVAHCGWRGLAAGMVASLVAAIEQRTPASPATWQAFVGPCISQAAYQVDAPVLNARAWPDEALQPDGPDHARLNLAAVIVHDLAQAGVLNPRSAGVCTAHDARLHSYRHQGQGCSQLLVAW